MNTIQEYIELLAARNEQIRELQERISGLETELVKREAELINLEHLQERISGLEAELSKREIEL